MTLALIGFLLASAVLVFGLGVVAGAYAASRSWQRHGDEVDAIHERTCRELNATWRDTCSRVAATYRGALARKPTRGDG